MAGLVRIVAPDKYPLSLVEVKSHLNISHADWDAKLDQFLAAATQHMDGPDGILGRAIMPQTWEYYLDNFMDCSYDNQEGYLWGNISLISNRRLDIPLPPLLSLDSIKYVGQDDTLTEVDPDTYQLIRSATPNLCSYVVPFPTSPWPVTKWQADAVKITFTAGYAEGHVPETLKQALLLTISHWNENRESWTVDDLNELPDGVCNLLGASLRRIPV